MKIKFPFILDVSNSLDAQHRLIFIIGITNDKYDAIFYDDFNEKWHSCTIPLNYISSSLLLKHKAPTQNITKIILPF